MTFKTFLGLVIALVSVFCIVISLDIIRCTKEPVWAFMTIISGCGVLAGIEYAIKGTKLYEKIANLFDDKEGE